MVNRGNKMPKESINKNIEVLAEDLSKAKLVGAEELIPLIAGQNNDKLREAIEKFIANRDGGEHIVLCKIAV